MTSTPTVANHCISEASTHKPKKFTCKQLGWTTTCKGADEAPGVPGGDGEAMVVARFNNGGEERGDFNIMGFHYGKLLGEHGEASVDHLVKPFCWLTSWGFWKTGAAGKNEPWKLEYREYEYVNTHILCICIRVCIYIYIHNNYISMCICVYIYIIYI